MQAKVDHQLEVDLALGLDPEIAMQGFLLRQAQYETNAKVQIALKVLDTLRTFQLAENALNIGPRVERDRQAETGENSPLED